jgi:MiaB/RimO family radical SAM methylthiotransferase
MNVNDSDIVRSLLFDAGMKETDDEQLANVLLTNTCAIREGAERKVHQRLLNLRTRFRKQKKIVGVLGCMAERLKEDLLQEGIVDLVVGPDAYRDLPHLVTQLLDEEPVEQEQAVLVQLSLDETYADVTPVRRNADDVAAFVSIQRGCNNRCSFCIVPFTRGQERSRPLDSIIREIENLHESGVKEVTLLGQNVNSYHDRSATALEARPDSGYTLSNDGFRSRIHRDDAGFFFADLLQAVSDISPELRVRFTSPHPKDYPPELLSLMAERPNICNHLHMPAQSGSSSVLKRMKRGYTREAYLELIENVHSVIPNVAISSDFIAGFCGETEEEHMDTLSLMKKVRYDQAFMFAYSMREKTHAHRAMDDNVEETVKQRRLREVIDTFYEGVQAKNEQNEVGQLRLVLVEGQSKRGHETWNGRTDQNKRIFFQNDPCWTDESVEPLLHAIRQGNRISTATFPRVSLQSGDYGVVLVTQAKGHTLRGRLLWRTSIVNHSGLSKTNEETLRDALNVDSFDEEAGDPLHAGLTL